VTQRQLFLIRHPPVAVAAGVCYGASDVALSVDVRQVAGVLRSQLPESFRLVSSPSMRCLQLAHALHAAPDSDPRLREMSFGSWEMQRFDDLPRADIDRWAADMWGFCPPDGESAHDMAQRSWDAWLDIATHDGHLVIVSHGGPLRVIAGRLTGLARDAWLDRPCPQGEATHFALATDGMSAREVRVQT
jgi:alpha-ribazole phosphatase